MGFIHRNAYIIFATEEWRDAVFEKIIYELDLYKIEYKVTKDRDSILIKAGTYYINMQPYKTLFCGQRMDEIYFQPCLFRKSYRFKTRDLFERLVPGLMSNYCFLFVILDMDKADEKTRLMSLIIDLKSYLKSCAKEEPYLITDYPILFL